MDRSTTRDAPGALKANGHLAKRREKATLRSSTPISEAERAFRMELARRIRANRDAQRPLGIPADQLVREARAEAYGDDA
jgi:hypothetical protein